MLLLDNTSGRSEELTIVLPFFRVPFEGKDLMKYVKTSFSASLAVNEIATGEYLSVDTV